MPNTTGTRNRVVHYDRCSSSRASEVAVSASPGARDVDVGVPPELVAQFNDHDHTWIDEHRPALRDLLKQVATGSVDVVIVEDVTRFGRRTVEAMEMMKSVEGNGTRILVTDVTAQHDGDTGDVQ